MPKVRVHHVVDRRWCSCGRSKLQRDPGGKCEPCHAIDNYRLGRYERTTVIINRGDYVQINGHTVQVIKTLRRDPNSPPSLVEFLDEFNNVYTVPISQVESIARS